MMPGSKYRHTTSDLWEAAAVWAHRIPLSHTERDGDKTVFCFAISTDVGEVAERHRRGTLKVPSLLMREGYFQMRHALTHGSSDARRR